MASGKAEDSILDACKVLKVRAHICVPRVGDIILSLLAEAYGSRFSIHPSATKKYRDLRQLYWWPRIKREIVEYVAKY